MRPKFVVAWLLWHGDGMLEDRILFLDGEALVLDKPAGFPVDRPRDGSLSIEDARKSLTFGFKRPPSIVHRLDRDTSGVLLLARNDQAHRRFAAAFEQGIAIKTYVAVVDGVPNDATGLIELPLAKVSTREAGWRIVAAPSGKPSVSAWRVLGEVEGRALIEFRPRTGRTHQLRVHAATGIGLPIVGDLVYGCAGGAGANRPGQRLLLHALHLEIARKGKPPVATCSAPPAPFDPWRHLLGSYGDCAEAIAIQSSR